MTTDAAITQPAIIPVILCGGSGTRLWPASRENLPKQFLSLMDDFSLLQNTVRRSLRITQSRDFVCVTLESMKDSVEEQLAELDPDAHAHILSEPSARNTAAAIALAAAYIANTFGDNAVMWVLPADHHIAREEGLASAYRKALKAAQTGALVTFGIAPSRPDTGYGYIRSGAKAKDLSGVYAVEYFREKPNAETAQSYLDSGAYLWNSGMFLFSVQSLVDEYRAHRADILKLVQKSMAISAQNPDAALYAAIPSASFDKAVMEKSGRVMVVPCDPEWSDIGSWESLWEISDKDSNSNVIKGRAAYYNAKGCLIKGHDRLIAVAGLKDIVVIETDDAILISNKHDGESMKNLVTKLKKAGAPEAMDASAAAHANPAQPWTMVKNLSDPSGMSAREIIIPAGEHREFNGAESSLCLYTVTEGAAAFSIDGTMKNVSAFESMNIDTAAPYAIYSTGHVDLKMILVQKEREQGIFFGTVNPSRKTA